MANFKKAPVPKQPEAEPEAADPLANAMAWLSGGEGGVPNGVWIVAGIIALIALGVFMRRSAGAAPAIECSWKRIGERGWACSTCGVQGETSSGRRPTECMRKKR